MNILDPIAQEIQKHTGLTLTKETGIYGHIHTAQIPNTNTLILFGLLPNYRQGTHYLIIKATSKINPILNKPQPNKTDQLAAIKSSKPPKNS